MSRIELIREEIGTPLKTKYAGKTYAEIATLLNQKTAIPNPTPCPQIPQPMILQEAVSQLTPQEKLVIYQNNLKPDIDDAIQYNKTDNLAALLDVVKLLISSESANKIQVLLARKINDPMWQPIIYTASIAETGGYPNVTSQEVQQALN